MIKEKNILVTGGTGSFGNKFVKRILENYNPERIVVFSRDEMKQWHMAKLFSGDKRVRFFIGDVRDPDRLNRALDGIDYVVHAAALKIVPSAEYNPFEFIKTNINGAMNLIDKCIDRKIKRVVALSTDKACNPINFYGATKLASDKLFIAGNSYSGHHETRFSVVRYGNIVGSRGSVIPFFIEQMKANKNFTVTDKRMTRFFTTLDVAIDQVIHALEDTTGGEIYVRKCPSIKITDITKSLDPDRKVDFIGIRPGEKMHEQMISSSDSYYTYDYEKYYKILPSIHNWSQDKIKIGNGKLVEENFSYSSENNSHWIKENELKKFIKENIDY